MHVQCTCKCFAPIAVLALIEAKRWSPLMPNLQVTCIEHQSVCFYVQRLCEVQAARAMTANLYSRGILRF